MEIAHSVYDDDLRIIAQRRADALGALAAGDERLVCDAAAQTASPPSLMTRGQAA